MASKGPNYRKSGSRRVTLGIILAVCLAFVLAQSAPQVSNLFNPVRTTVSDRIGAPGEPSFWARVTGQAARERRIRELENEVRDLARFKAAAISMAERLETYEDILRLMGEPPERGVTARVILEVNGPFSRTMLANAGRRHGVEPGAVALNEGGLVGRVIHIGERSSRILLIDDALSRIPVMGETSGMRAIMREGDLRTARLLDLPEEGRFVPGERVLTSGDGGVFPRGMVVGLAEEDSTGFRVRYSKNDHARGYVRLIQPAVIEPPPDLEENIEPESQLAASPVQGAP
jgi:rod shape-determining protein MreC